MGTRVRRIAAGAEGLEGMRLAVDEELDAPGPLAVVDFGGCAIRCSVIVGQRGLRPWRRGGVATARDEPK